MYNVHFLIIFILGLEKFVTLLFEAETTNRIWAYAAIKERKQKRKAAHKRELK